MRELTSSLSPCCCHSKHWTEFLKQCRLNNVQKLHEGSDSEAGRSDEVTQGQGLCMLIAGGRDHRGVPVSRRAVTTLTCDFWSPGGCSVTMAPWWLPQMAEQICPEPWEQRPLCKGTFSVVLYSLIQQPSVSTGLMLCFHAGHGGPRLTGGH